MSELFNKIQMIESIIVINVTIRCFKDEVH